MAKAQIIIKAINKQAVFEAASAIAKRDEMPTIKKIRQQLGGQGSETTLHKYLALWKRALLGLAQHLNEKPFKTPDTAIALEKALQAETSKSKVLAEELIKTEKEASGLQEELVLLQKELAKALEQNKSLLLKSNQLEILIQEIRVERESMLEVVLNDKNKQIEMLQQELKEMNQENLEYIKKIGFESDEALLSQKVKVIHLEDKLEALTKEMHSLRMELTKERERHLPLIQQVHKQKAFIQKIVSFEQMQEYESLMSKD